MNNNTIELTFKLNDKETKLIKDLALYIKLEDYDIACHLLNSVAKAKGFNWRHLSPFDISEYL